MSVRGRMKDTGITVGHMRLYSNKAEIIHKARRKIPYRHAIGRLKAKAHHSAAAFRHVFLLQGMIRRRLQVREIDPCHIVRCFQIARHFQGGRAVTRHSHMKRLKPEPEIKGVLRRLYGPHVTHQCSSGLGDICELSETLRKCQPVVGRIRSSEPRVFVRVRIPVKITAVHDNSPDLHTVSVHIFSSRVRDDVSSPLERTAVDRSWEGIVHDKRYAV
ncbi:uncharacterized protein BN459_00707 [Bacteroides sp. CAG:1060]|nr:uncharacterized protein BN459_00707 [Bacteroides sp. CAG:1060]